MRKLFFVILAAWVGIIIYFNLQKKPSNYILDKTAFCTGLGTMIEDKQPVVCKDIDGNLISGRIISYFGNGSIDRDFIVTNGRAEGVFKTYYVNGNLKTSSIMKQGIPDGQRVTYYENGNIRTEGNIKYGYRNGLNKTYYENGNLQYEANIENGVVNHGNVKKYYENGNLQLDCFLKDGELDGAYTEYYENGEVKETTFYVKDKKDGVYRAYYENGVLKESSNYKNGKIEGEIKRYYESGRLKISGFVKNDKWDGQCKNYYTNGQLERDLNYKEGKLDGTSYVYTNFGALLIKTTYKNGEELNKELTPESELTDKCKQYFNVCASDKQTVGCLKKIFARVNTVDAKGFFVKEGFFGDSIAFVYTNKKYANQDKVDSDFYYEYVGTVDHVDSNGKPQRVRAYKETEIEALCDDLYKPFRL